MKKFLVLLILFFLLVPSIGFGQIILEPMGGQIIQVISCPCSLGRMFLLKRTLLIGDSLTPTITYETFFLSIFAISYTKPLILRSGNYVLGFSIKSPEPIPCLSMTCLPIGFANNLVISIGTGQPPSYFNK